VIIGTLVAAACTACGGGGTAEDADAGVDAGPPPDAEGPHVCLTVPDFATPTLTNQVAPGVGDPATPDAISFQGDLNADATPDVLQIELVSGYGVFLEGVTTGTFPLADDELNYATCGLCVRVFTDVEDGGGHAMQQYFATGGTVTITSIDPNITGTVTDVDFVEVTVATDGTYTTTPVTDGCSTAVASTAFDVAVTY
jgi:hypothetical protein